MFVPETNRILHTQALPYYCKNDTEADGNCFFHAIVDQLKNPEIAASISDRASHIDLSSHLAIRRAVVDFCRYNNDLQETDFPTWKDNFLAEEKQKSHFFGLHNDIIWRMWLENMEKSGTWVEEIFVLTTALFFGKDLLIVQPNFHYTVSGAMVGQQSHGPPFALVHLHGNHFQSVQRIKEVGLNNQDGNQQNQPVRHWWHSICWLL